MPRIPPASRARILQRLELESMLGKAKMLAEGDEFFAICRDHVGHGPAKPHVTVEPDPAIKGVDHSIAPTPELYRCWCGE